MKFDRLFDGIFSCINELMQTPEMVILGVQIRQKMLKVRSIFNFFCCYNVLDLKNSVQWYFEYNSSVFKSLKILILREFDKN